MISLENVTPYCTVPKVVELAKYCAPQLAFTDETYAFVYAGLTGMQFEDETDERYIELNIREDEENKIEICIYMVTRPDTHTELIFTNIDEAIEKWNDVLKK